MAEQSNSPLHDFELNVQSDLTVQKNDIINKLHNKINDKTGLAPSEVQSTLLCSNNIVTDCTSLGGNSPQKQDFTNLKLLLKDLAKQIIKQTYEEIRNGGSNIH
jgi:hypothetical protein